MGRKPSKPNAVPRLRARVRGKVTYWFYDHGGKPRREESLGTDYGLAIKRWAELERTTPQAAPLVLTLRYVGDRYLVAAEAGTLPRTKAPRTIADNRKELAKLLEFFDDPPGPLDAIKPKHVRQYMRWRGDTARTRANREKSLLSALWNFARDEGYTDLPNPCAGIKGFEEVPRDAYVDDAQFAAIWKVADVCLRDAMDLAYLTGQRPTDVLRLTDMDVREGALHVRQGKTGTKVRIEVIGELTRLLERIRERKRAHKVWCTRLVVSPKGRAQGANAMSRRWAAACATAGIAGLQFRDLRAKAATDTEASTGNIRDAQRQLGHASVTMTETYTRNRLGAKVKPTR